MPELITEFDSEGNLAYAEFDGADIEIEQYGYGYLIRIETGDERSVTIRMASRTPIDCRVDAGDD
jgi:hypothetical protein